MFVVFSADALIALFDPQKPGRIRARGRASYASLEFVQRAEAAAVWINLHGHVFSLDDSVGFLPIAERHRGTSGCHVGELTCDVDPKTAQRPSRAGTR